ncbi:hypothetical protein CKQ84_18500 [Shewanella sp. WE21]|uniref:hypothetical protein n=1 Tax=Shewanella sp. WE21 TaxID=2029986 RepID=UPI000CF65729|nr:hypothetical protein [Shewanella sp. WE21]AVI67688.1 hypothetical protein CKQ84_18500 [Shewanella sp. WE21]
MKVTFSGSIPKDLNFPEENEDYWATSACGNRIALCDGASESYSSKLWSRMIAESFIKIKRLDFPWIQALSLDYSKCYDFNAMSWSQQAAYERGSFSTLLGVDYKPKSTNLKITAIGDSVALLFDEGKLVASWPFTEPEQFLGRPTLLSTRISLNDFIKSKDCIKNNSKTVRISDLSTPTLICLTDAIGEWALRMLVTNNEKALALHEIETLEAFEHLVVTERAAGTMKIDDSTMIRFALKG